MAKQNKTHRLDGRYIKIRQSFIIDVQEGRYTTNDLLFFSAIKMVATEIETTEMAILNVDMLLVLTGLAKNSRNKRLAKESLANLVKGKLIKVYKDIMKSSENKSIETADTLFIAITEDELKDGGRFTKLRHFEFNNIINSGEKNPGKMLLMFCAIIVEVFETGELKQTNISNDRLCEECRLDRKTVIKYIKILEEVKVLYRKKVRYIDNEDVLRHKNIFTRYDWSSFIESRYM